MFGISHLGDGAAPLVIRAIENEFKARVQAIVKTHPHLPEEIQKLEGALEKISPILQEMEPYIPTVLNYLFPKLGEDKVRILNDAVKEIAAVEQSLAAEVALIEKELEVK